MSPCGWTLAHLWSCCTSLLQVSLLCRRWAGDYQAALFWKLWESVVLTAGVELLEGRLVYYWQRLWHLQQDPSWHWHPCASSPLPSGMCSCSQFLSLDSLLYISILRFLHDTISFWLNLPQILWLSAQLGWLTPAPKSRGIHTVTHCMFTYLHVVLSQQSVVYIGHVLYVYAIYGRISMMALCHSMKLWTQVVDMHCNLEARTERTEQGSEITILLFTDASLQSGGGNRGHQANHEGLLQGTREKQGPHPVPPLGSPQQVLSAGPFRGRSGRHCILWERPWVCRQPESFSEEGFSLIWECNAKAPVCVTTFI